MHCSLLQEYVEKHAVILRLLGCHPGCMQLVCTINHFSLLAYLLSMLCQLLGLFPKVTSLPRCQYEGLSTLQYLSVSYRPLEILVVKCRQHLSAQSLHLLQMCAM